MNRFYNDDVLDKIVSAMSEIPEKFLRNAHGETKSIPFAELKQLLDINQSKTLSKCIKQFDNLGDDLSARFNIHVRLSKHSAWIWFNFFGEYKGYTKDQQIANRLIYEEKKKLDEINKEEQKKLHLKSVNDGTYGVNSKDKGGVYLLSCGDFYKIGRSIDIEKRLSSIRSSNPVTVELVTKYSSFDKNYTDLEKHLHNKFKDSRHVLEWFRKDFTAEDFLQACIEFCKKV